MRIQRANSSGFTLIEVLIAAIILFSSISLIAELFKSATFNSNKAANVAKVYQLAPTALDMIKAQIQAAASSQYPPQIMGSLELGTVTYNYEAKRTSFLPEALVTEEGLNPQNRFALYDVTVLMTYGNTERAFNTKVATW
ncbi:type IV pilus modification PilV family protein [Pseudoalteromonas pernae]|uniref:type IV pilus modification PilV family protein n=1 Tax=Pseudoalteromonas pernae TaxID=3118054 RepID=UPI003242B2F4